MLSHSCNCRSLVPVPYIFMSRLRGSDFGVGMIVGDTGTQHLVQGPSELDRDQFPCFIDVLSLSGE